MTVHYVILPTRQLLSRFRSVPTRTTARRMAKKGGARLNPRFLLQLRRAIPLQPASYICNICHIAN